MGKVVRVQAIVVNSQIKIAVKLSIESKKTRVKGMRCAASCSGVIAVSLSSHTMTVVGREIDVVGLTKRLNRVLGYAELRMVSKVDKSHEKNLAKHMKPECIPPYYYDNPVGARVAQLRYNIYDNAQDRLLLWRLNHTQKDGSLSSEEGKQKWKLACQILAEKGLIPEDENIEENERVYTAVMESEHPNSILCKDFGMTFRKIFSDNAPNFDGAESSNNKAELAKLAEEMSEQRQEIQSLKNTMNQLVALLQQQCQVSQSFLPSTTDAGKKNTGAWKDEITEEL